MSLRLVAEFERGQRSNVSLESALRLCKSVGIASVAAISETAYNIASSGHGRPAVSGKKRTRG